MAHTKVTKAYSANTGAANTYSYSGSFDTFKATEVVVELDNVALTYTASTINESASPREYTVDYANKTIHIGGANLSSGTIVIKPVTDLGSPTPRATYTPGASITSEDLNNNQKQLLRRAMEYEEQVMFKTGGTFTGDVEMGEDKVIKFEGATADGYETTLTVTDPTADRTITLPNVTGTVVTTGDTGTVTATMLAADSVDSSELVDGSIDASHIASNAVITVKINNDAVTGAKIADDAIDSEHYVNGSIDTAHIADDAVDNTKIATNAVNRDSIQDGEVIRDKIAADAINGAKIVDDAVDSEHIASGAVDLDHMSVNSVDSDQYVDGSIDLAHMSANSVDSDQYVDGSIDTAHLADDAVDADKLAANAVVNASVASGAAIDHAKLAAVSSGNILVGNGSNQAASVAMSGDVAIAAGGATTIQANSVEIGMIGCEQTTISDSDSHIPTSGAVVDYVASVVGPIGGLEVIADDESFPNTIPAAGVVISITDAAGLQVNSSGVSTNGDALDNSTITINGFPSELRGGVGSNADPYEFQSGAGLMVVSTGSSHTYNYHQALIREADFVNLSDDINDFNNRYRIGTRTANSASSNDDGDLFFDTGTNKMYVYDGAYDAGGEWKEVTSAGDYKLLGIKDNGQAHNGTGPTFNDSNDQYDLFDGTSDASITSAGQLIVVLNGVIQKPNASYDASGEGFALDGSDGIRFCDPPPSGSVCFVTQIGTATTLNVPADNSVSQAKIQNGAVDTAQLAADAVDGTRIADDAIDSEHYTNASIDHAHLANDCVDGDNIADDAINSEHYVDASIDHQHLANDCVDGDNLADNAVDSEHYTDGSIDHAHLANDCVDGDNLADNACDSEHYTDGSVDIVHLANGTDGQIITWNASGVATAVGPGTDGQVLTSTGAGSPPAFEDAASGGISSDAQGNTVGGSNAGDSFTGTDANYNTLIGKDAGTAVTSGDSNTALGFEALKTTSTTSKCTAIGKEALEDVTQDACTAVGNEAGKGITNGDHNTAVGNQALKGDGSNAVTGAANVAVGSMCMLDNQSGGNNTAVGYKAMENNTTGGSNVSMGWKCMDANTTGSDNVAIGREALVQNQTANYNVCIGNYAGRALQDGADYNVAIGNIAFGNASASGMVGDKNVAVGFDSMSGSALTDCYANTCVGWATMHSCTNASRCTAIGEGAGYYITSGANNHCIGFNAGQSSSPSGSITTGDNNFVLGNNNIANLYCADTSISSSDERDKTDITDWTHGLDWINKLKPITYRWDKRSWYLKEGEDDITKVTRDGSKKTARRHLGFKAQDILAVEQSFGYAGKKDDMLTVNLNEDDTAYGMKYERLVVVLTKAVQELSAKNDALEARIAALEAK